MQIDPLLVDLITIAVTLIGAFLIIKILVHFIKKTGAKFDLEITLVQVLEEIVKYTVMALALVIILNELGVNIGGLILSLGILGVAVGFAARDTLSNYISGLFVVGDKSFKVGDIVEINNKKGKIIKMGLRVTNMLTDDNKTITVPNSVFSKNLYLNYTAQDRRRVELDLNIPYELDLETVIKNSKKAASGLTWVLNEPEPKFLVKELSDTGVKATLNVWTDDPWKVINYQSVLAEKIKKVLVPDNA
ncbi:MAG: mechanosensitive ion channel family protein [Methanobacteriaceae archaeon]|nr:mechanosensitive ion channel family protein [Methanobacteriaceae archaeon]